MRQFLFFIACLVLSAIILGWVFWTEHVRVNSTPPPDLKLADTTATAPGNSANPSPFIDELKGHLIAMDHGTQREVDASTLKNVKYWAFYHSASWCPPCRAFTPELVDFYKDFKTSHPNFELIFVSADSDEQSMLAYMQDDGMAWPAVKFGESDQSGLGIQKYFGSGIPDLVLTDENGQVLSDSFHGQDYVGPEQVVDDIKKMVPQPDGT